MLDGGALGFSSVVVLVVVLLSGQLIAFAVVRRKWRIAVARREEVKRLLALASEEATRAELEAAAAYVHGNGNSYNYTFVSAFESEAASRPFQAQCAVCFCPTTTRCARCKSVRYCSGKCQIIHWRQGHREECHPFTSPHKINGVESCSGQKVIKQEEYDTDTGSFQFEGRQHVKLVETLAAAPSISSSTPCKVLDKKNEFGIKCFAEEKETSSASKFTNHSSEGFSASSASGESSMAGSSNNTTHSDILEAQQSANLVCHKFETDFVNMGKTRSQVSNQPDIDKSVDGLTHSCNQTKTSLIDGDAFSGSPSSSASSVDDSNEPSFFEPATPSHDFWEGTIDSRRLRIDAPDDSARLNSSEAGDGNMSNRRLSFSFDLVKDTVPPVDVKSSGTKIITSDDTHPTAASNEKPINEAPVSEEIRKDTQKHKKSLSSSSEISNVDIKACNSQHAFREVKYSSSGSPCAYPVSGDGRHPTSKEALKVCSSFSLKNDGSNHVVNDRASISLTRGTGDVGHLTSKVSEAPLSSRMGLQSSCPGMHSVESGKFMKVDGVDGVATCSSQLGGYSQNSRSGVKTSVWKVVDHLRAAKLSRHYLVGAGSDIAGRYNGKGMFSYDLFVKLYNWNQVELRPCGLINCGNSCYANAVLQCLAFTPPLTAYLLQGLHSKACEKKEWCFTCEFESLVLKAKAGSSPLSPIGILSQIQTIGSHLGNGREEDAHEFLRYAIDTMQAVCLKGAGGNASGLLEEQRTLIDLTFGGYLRSKIKCMRCGGKSERHERMMDLTVEIEGDIRTLEEALHQFTGTETLDGENKYECSRCKSYEKAKKKLTVLEAPNVLTIVLKRFQSGKFGKLNKLIQFPEILDMAPFISGTSDKGPIYRLYGVVVHLDIMNAAFSGHYVCYVKNVQNKWFKIDDSMVKAVEFDTVLKKGAYILLYARLSPRSPRFIKNSIIPGDPRKPNSAALKSRFYQVYPHNVPVHDLVGHMGTECSCGDDASYHPILEEDSSSDNSSSFFSEGGSCSTDSSNRDTASMEDYIDQIFGDLGHNWNSPWRTSSDSDTSSSSSSPSAMYAGHSSLGELDQYVSKYRENSGSQVNDAELAVDGRGFWARPFNKSSKLEHLEGKGSSSFLYPNSTKQHRKLASSCSCRESSSHRLGWVNPFNHLKSGVPFRRSIRERRD